MAYYELVDCVWRSEERWHLDVVIDQEGGDLTWAFCACVPFAHKSDLRTRAYEEGPPVDFTIAGLATPILSPRAVTVLRPVLTEFCEFIPVQVEEHPPGYSILNVLRA